MKKIHTDEIKKLQLLVSGSTNGNLVEDIIQSIYSEFVSQGNLVIDGGAADGRHTAPLSSLVGKFGIVIAVEPLYHFIYRQRPWASNYMFENVFVENIALSNTPGHSLFNCIENSPGYSGLKRGYWPNDVNPNLIEVEVSTIDLIYLKNLDKVNNKKLSFIKLDLEGGEYDAICGGFKSITEHQPLIIFEHAKTAAPLNYKYQPNSLFGLAEKLGMEIYDIFGRCYSSYTEFDNMTPHYLAMIPQSHCSKYVKVIEEKIYKLVTP